ncbi:MAG: purine-nucleoside phosphorylase [Eubacteriales bacterium]
MSKLPYPTPHIEATPEDFAKVVLMPGDPLRAKWIAENFLDDARQVNFRRCAYAYTGTYHGVPVTVMASGMGMPSMGIYSYELFHIFGVEAIIRIGTAGGISDSVAVRDLVIGQGACTDSAYASQFGLPGSFAPIGDYGLLSVAVECAGNRGVTTHVGNLVTSDTFYSDNSDAIAKWKKMGVLATEMETAALYMNAARAGKKALSVCTVSDHFYSPVSLTAAERETTLTQMIEVALDTAEQAIRRKLV